MEFPFDEIKINDKFWNARLELNANKAIIYQWNQLELTKCIDNFRILSGKKEGFREGWFFSDSDAFKWLDAASRVYVNYPKKEIKDFMNEFINLIEESQDEKGYINTYNQLLFPSVRWKNIQIEHELYCIGHLIEAGISHFNSTQEENLLNISKKAVDFILNSLDSKDPKYTPGHQEIEIALLKLYNITKNDSYLELASDLLYNRGKIGLFFFHFLKNSISTGKRSKYVTKKKKEYVEKHPDLEEFKLPEHVSIKKPKGILARSFFIFASGRYNQQHKSIINQHKPEGHSVRFAYMETAAAMLYQINNDENILNSLKNAWDYMVKKRMFVSGGIGSIPLIEGFGFDYELDPEYAYCETCAALGSIFWSWEMLKITNEAKYADLIEWQLYNAASVGISQNGTSYLYRNPLGSKGLLKREAWFQVPCCPSNISRTWASIGKYLYTYDEDEDEISIHQFIGNTFLIPKSEKKSAKLNGISISMESSLPWEGKVKIKFSNCYNVRFKLRLRIPSWSKHTKITINGTEESFFLNSDLENKEKEKTASGYSPYGSRYYTIDRIWNNGDCINIQFSTDIQLHYPHPKTKALKGTVAISLGPILFCTESIDNSEIDLFNDRFDVNNLESKFNEELFGGVCCISGITVDGKKFMMIPYYCWSNRGISQMNVNLKY